MKNSKYPKLFEKGYIGKLEIKNRIVRMPMGTDLGNPDGSASDRQITAYAEAADGGVGIVYMDAYAPVKIHHVGLSAHTDSMIANLSLLAEAIKYHGAIAGAQIAHPGRDAGFVGGDDLVAPSAIQWEPWYQAGAAIPRELSLKEIQEMVSAYGDAARRCKIAGFDIVDIHAACGTLASNFLSPVNNRRNDMYGGSLHNRARFVIEIIKDIKKKTGPNYPVSVRLSCDDNEPGGIRVEETIEVAKMCEAAGADVINITGGSHAEVIRCASIFLPWGINLEDAAKIKKAVNIPVMCAGGFKTPEFAEKALAEGKIDYIGLGKPVLADPFWAKKAKEGRAEDIKPCINCMVGCHDRGLLVSRVPHCAVNPTLYKYEAPAIIPAETPKNVAVIGGGPAGIEAAITATQRGHNVTIYEKRELGGAMIEASVPSYKTDINLLIEYYKIQLKKLNIKVVKEEATIDTIKKGNFDAAIVAVGGKIRTVDIPGIDNKIVTYAMDVLGKNAPTGQKVVIVGGGISGVETADMLAEQGKDVTIVTSKSRDSFLRDAGVSGIGYMQKIVKAGIKVLNGNRLVGVKDHAAVLLDNSGKRSELEVDSIVISLGFVPQKELATQIDEETDIEVYTAGDCRSARLIQDAVHEGYIAGRLV